MEGYPATPMDVKNRQIETQRNVLNALGELLVPVTEGFEHVNLDMAFTYLGNWDLITVENLSGGINICHLWGLRQSEFLLRGKLATRLVSCRSRNAKAMNMFTEVTTKQEQTFKDETKKQGFSWMGMGNTRGEK